MKDRPNWRDEGEEAGQAMEEFQDRHRSFTDRVERFVMQLVILGLVALVLVQTLQVIPFVRRYVSYAEALEGVSASEMAAWRNGAPGGDPAEAVVPAAGSQAGKYSVTVVLMSDRSAPTARLLVDGRVAGTFSGSTVTAQVRPGQTLTVDGSRADKALTFRVVAAPGLASPALGAEVRTSGDRQSLGTVQVDD